jgi:hypothetical protein
VETLRQPLFGVDSSIERARGHAQLIAGQVAVVDRLAVIKATVKLATSS